MLFKTTKQPLASEVEMTCKYVDGAGKKRWKGGKEHVGARAMNEMNDLSVSN